MRSWIRLVLCLIVTVHYSATQNAEEHTVNPALIEAIFGKRPTTAKPIIADRNKEPCECVPYYLCKENGTINTDGEGIFDIRIDDEETPPSECPNYLLICCKKADQVEEKILPPPLPPRKGCGYSHPDGVGFRTNGDRKREAKFGEFPWMVAILTHEDKGPMYKCGGALIHPRAVVTAAHCVANNKKKYAIRAGEWDTQTNLEIFPHQEVEVEEVIIHPKFYSGGLHNDMALVILREAIQYKDHIDVLCLPPQDFNVPDLTECTATGWGRDVFGKEGKYQVILKKINLPIMERNYCQETLRNTRLGKYFLLDKSFICAGGVKGEDTCQGDGGSPLVCPIPGQKGRYHQAGIVAWGIDCGTNGIPGVYVNVPLFRDWVDDEMKKHDLDLTEYQY